MIQTSIQPACDFSAILNAIPGACLVLLPDAPKFTILAVTDAYLFASSVDRNEIINRGFFEMIEESAEMKHSFDFAELEAALMEVLKTKISNHLLAKRPELKVTRNNGSLKLWKASNKPVLNVDHSVRYIIHSIEEASGRNAALDTLKEEHRRLLEAQAIGSIGSFEWNLGEENVVWSDQMYRINGLNPQSERITIGRTNELIHPDDLHHVNQLKERSFITPGQYELTHRIVLDDATVKWVTHRFETVSHDGAKVVRVHGTLQDITERKTAEQELLQIKEEMAQSATKKYLELFQSIDQGFCTIALKYVNDRPVDYQFIEVSPSFEHQTGIKDASGRWMRDIASDQDEFWFETYGQVAEDREPRRFEYFSTPLRRWYSVYAFPIDAPVQRHIGVLFNDITERKHQQKKNAFLLRLSDTLRSIRDVGNIQKEACQLISDELGVRRAFYVELGEEKNYGAVLQEYKSDDMRSMVGLHNLSIFQWALPIFHRNDPIIITDTQTSVLVPELIKKAMADLQLLAVLALPLLKEQVLVGALVLAQPHPKEWNDFEVELVREVVERISGAVARAKAERALRLSEGRLQRMVNVPKVGVLTFEYSARMLHANDAFLQMVGYSREDFESREFTWQDFTPPEHMEASLQVWNQMHEITLGGPYEKEYYRKDGSRIWLMFVAADLGDGTLVKYAIDISDRKRAEEALQQLSQHLEVEVAERTAKLNKMTEELQNNLAILQQAENLAQIGSWEYDYANKAFTWSKGMYQLFCLPRETGIEPEIYIQSAFPEDIGSAEQIAKKIREGALPLPDTVSIKADNIIKILKIEAMVVNDAEGNPTRMIGVDMDITGEREAAKTLNEQAHFIQSTNEALPDILYVLNLTTKDFIYINHTFEERLGYTETGSEKNILHLLCEEDLPAMIDHLEEMRVAADGVVYEIEYRLPAADGSLHWFRDRNSVFKRDKDGTAVEKIGIAQDVTARKKAEQELKESNTALRYANENLEQFASIASHDLQEPLRKLKMFASVLKRYDKDLPDEAKEVLQKISLTSERLRQLITEVLQYSKVAYGTKEFALVSLHDILQRVLSDLDLLLGDTNAAIQYDNPLPEVEAIPPQMNQLFYNLLTNSLKFHKDGTRPIINISYRKLTQSQVSDYPELNAYNAHIAILISDNGVGFNQMYAEQIFQIFERLYPVEEFEGTGLGLALCKKIAENHSGHIFAESKDGEGARFTILLPVKQIISENNK